MTRAAMGTVHGVANIMGGGLLTEPDVTLTDYSLAILCSWFAWNLWKQRTAFRHFQIFWMIFFASVAAASLAGGTVHGFFLDKSTFGHQLLWPVTLLAIGITAATAWLLIQPTLIIILRII